MVVNRLSNEGFDGDLSNWNAVNGASYVADQGHNELGAAYLASAGHAISQSFAIPVGRPWLIDIWAKGTGAGNVTLTITDSGNNTVYTSTITVTTAWTKAHSARVGLPSGTYTFTLTYGSVAVYVDDISLARVEKTRPELAQDVARLLGDLATVDAAYSPISTGDHTEGDYTEAIDAGLRAIGALDEAGRPDVRYLTEDNVDAAVDEVQRYMLHKLHRYYARNATDFTLEGRSESYSQRRGAIENLLGISVGGRNAASGRGVVQRRLIHQG